MLLGCEELAPEVEELGCEEEAEVVEPEPGVPELVKDPGVPEPVVVVAEPITNAMLSTKTSATVALVRP